MSLQDRLGALITAIGADIKAAALKPVITSPAYAATITPDAGSVGAHQVVNVGSLTGALTIGAPTGTPVDGQSILIRLKDNGTSRALTWNAAFVSSGVATLLAATVISKQHTILLVWHNSISKWVCLAVDSVGY